MLKKVILLFLMVCMYAVMVMSQNLVSSEIPYIEVTGSADMEIDPDEIRLSIVLSSYKKEDSKSEISLEQVEKEMISILSKHGISSQDIVLKNVSTEGYWSYRWRYDRERDEDPRLTKEYEVLFKDPSVINKVLSDFPGPKEGFLNVTISDLKNKNIQEYRRQTKIEAIKAAKEKAQYLLESVGQTAGKLIQVVELDEDDWGLRPYGLSNTLSQTSLNAGNGSSTDDPSVRKIKLRYRMKARFEIK